MTKPEIIEIRLHGRGGQGAVVASSIMATAAFLDGRYVQSFPTFGVERRGAPVAAFVRLSQSPILLRCAITEPHHLIVLDRNLLDQGATLQGLRPGGWIVVNTAAEDGAIPEPLAAMPCGVAYIDATDIAVRYQLGTRTAPIVNTAIVGAFARATGLISMDALSDAVTRTVPAHADKNIEAVRKAYRLTRIVRPCPAPEKPLEKVT